MKSTIIFFMLFILSISSNVFGQRPEKKFNKPQRKQSQRYITPRWQGIDSLINGKSFTLKKSSGSKSIRQKSSETVLGMGLDSIIISEDDYSQKEEFTYYPNGKTKTITRWENYGDGWEGIYRDHYFYDMTGQDSHLIFYIWNESEVWEEEFKEEYVFDSQGRLLSITSYLWEDDQWVPNEMEEIEVDEQGNEVVYIDSKWDNDLNVWQSLYKIEQAFDESGRIALLENFSWDEDEDKWIKTYKSEYEYTFDEQGHLLSLSNSKTIWLEGEIYEELEVSDFTYDEQGNMIGSIITFSPEHKSKYEFEWNNQGDKIKEVYFRYTLGEWEKISEDIRTYTYNSVGDITSLVFAKLDGEEWDYSKEEYDFDMSFGVDQLFLPRPNQEYGYDELIYNFDQELMIKKKPLEVRYSVKEDDQWFLQQKTVFYYSDLELSVLSGSDVRYNFYPNPTAGLVNFQVPQDTQNILEILDMQGNRVLLQEFRGGNTVSLDNLSPGLYMYKLITDEKQQSGKLIKQ